MYEIDSSRSLAISRLVDGELSSEEANLLLGEILQDRHLRHELQRELRLRSILQPWRMQTDGRIADRRLDSFAPDRSTSTKPADSRREPGRMTTRNLGGLLLGGLLVLAGFLIAQFTTERPDFAEMPHPGVSSLEKEEFFSPNWLITPEKKRQIEETFAQHESLLGPLALLVDSENTVQLDEARPPLENNSPIAIVLRMRNLSHAGNEVHEYVVVCREEKSAVIELPSPTIPWKIVLQPHLLEGGEKIDLQYAVSSSTAPRLTPAVLAGEQQLNAEGTPLGRLVASNEIYEIQAGAWPLSRSLP